MLCTNKLSQHVIGQLEAREARHSTPACSSLDKLSQHAVSQSEAREARYTIPACRRSQSQIGKARYAKALNSRQADTATNCATRRTRARGGAEQSATTP